MSTQCTFSCLSFSIQTLECVELDIEIFDVLGKSVLRVDNVRNTVNVSENTKEMLDHKFNFGEARIVQAKNIGDLNIYDVRM